MDLQKEREVFDAYFRDKYPELYKDVFDEDGDDREIIGYSFAWQSWQAAKAHESEKLKGCVVVPVNNTTIVAIEKMVEQQVEASGITADVFRLDGEKILNAAVEAARGGK